MKHALHSFYIFVLVITILSGCRDSDAPRPTEYRYSGPYLFLAEDGNGTDYPECQVDQTFFTQYGEIKAPSKWKQDESRQHIVVFHNTDGIKMMEIWIQSFYLSEPYFNVTPNHCDRICWEKLGNRIGYRIYALTAECDQPAASGDDSKTIRKYVYFISDVTGTHDGRQFHYGYYLCFNKAVIDNGEIQYFVSNRVIDEIVNSFVPDGFDSVRSPH